MKQVTLGRTGIRTSYAGMGTSAAYDGIVCGAKLRADDYPDLLAHAHEHGMRLWDTSLTYGTHAAVGKALKRTGRSSVTLITKTTDTSYRGAVKAVERSLREMATEYTDIFLLQCVRNRFDFKMRAGALKALCDLKKKGSVRAVGIASHGLGALEAALECPDIDVVMGRVNYSGHLMDSRQDDFKSVLAGIPLIKKMSVALLPKQVFKKAALSVQKPVAEDADRRHACELFKKFHARGTAVIGIKVIGEGNLSHDVAGAIRYVKGMDYISSMILGCCSREEISAALLALGTE
jgi:aryl-alcohol dehydrogenase-like predicted oxidoreductase